MVKKGDIYYANWGYDQTNIDFVKVVKVSPSGKTVLCRMMSEKVVKAEHTYDNIVPDKPYGKTFRLRVRDEGRVLVGSYPFCTGSKRYGRFYKWSGRPLYQTAYGFGH